MILYKYLCTNCDTLNHIHWAIEKDYEAPFCCECGQYKRTKYKFIKKVEVMENDNN
jgi:Zn ribbon nucleic-acid-binding protein